jgi:signal transduction histidine kinase
VDDFQRLETRAYGFLLLLNILNITIGVFVWLFAVSAGMSDLNAFVISILSMIVVVTVTARIGSARILQPLHLLWQAILHVSPETTTVAAPNMEKLRFGRELVFSLANRVYQFASQTDGVALADHRKTVLQAVNVVNHFPLPLFVFNKEQVVTNASDSALKYLSIESSQLFGHQIFEAVNLEFPSQHTLESWIKDCQANKVTDQAYWQRVRVNLRDGTTIKQCDIAAYYNRDNQSGTEFIVTFFDHTDAYAQDDQALSFVALAVHELRTPLTMLRGYIEVFEEELDGKLSPELSDYMHKLRLSADQLTAFVSNVLNVVKVEENQLTLTLTEKNWEQTLKAAAANQLSRAQVLGKNITFKVEPDIPTVGVDPVTISEVVNNLLDNALKYSGVSNDILVTSSVNKDGLVETTVQDNGVGIPESVLPNLFEKFYRNHRTRTQIGGTGLGLFLCKSIVDAHGGQIWVNSKVGQGSSFTFTILPYTQLAEELKNNNNEGITRQAHGWIKNHSFYRK